MITSQPNWDNLPEIVISASDNRTDWREVWQYRQLVLHFIWRDFKLRYRQTIIGIAWAIIQPFMTMVVFNIFLGRVAGLASEGVPYPVFLYAALLPWSFFSGAVTTASSSLVSNHVLVKKVYFPRIVLPIVYILVELVDFFVAFIILIFMLVAYQITPSLLAIVIVPAALLMGIMTAMGVGFALSAINVSFRDIRHIIPFVMQIWMFTTPVVYSSAKLEGNFHALMGLNPMATVVECFRWALLQHGKFPFDMLVVSIPVMIGTFFLGFIVFKKLEPNFSDVL